MNQKQQSQAIPGCTNALTEKPHLAPREQRCLDALIAHPSGIKSYDLRELTCCSYVPGVIQRLKAKGYEIDCTMKLDGYTAEGRSSSIGWYRLSVLDGLQVEGAVEPKQTIISPKNQQKENNMEPTNELKKIEIFEISRQEKEILCRLDDLVFKNNPAYMRNDCHDIECNCESKDDSVGFLGKSYSEVLDAFKFILKQILANNDLSRLNPFVDQLEDCLINDIIFAQTLGGDFYMSFGRFAEVDAE